MVSNIEGQPQNLNGYLLMMIIKSWLSSVFQKLVGGLVQVPYIRTFIAHITVEL